jgi:hypothetical protein
MKKILIISMMLVFGFSFSQETKKETLKEPIKIEKTNEINFDLITRLKKPNHKKLFSIPKRYRTKLC